jgi:hypothetical protein
MFKMLCHFSSCVYLAARQTPPEYLLADGTGSTFQLGKPKGKSIPHDTKF